MKEESVPDIRIRRGFAYKPFFRMFLGYSFSTNYLFEASYVGGGPRGCKTISLLIKTGINDRSEDFDGPECVNMWILKGQ